MLPFPFQKSNAFRILSFSLAVLIINLGGWQSARAKIQLDHAFVPVLGRQDNGPASALVLPDGKLVVIRLASQNILGKPEYKVTRLNADGSIDRIFDSVVLSDRYGKLLLQPDGKILVLYGGIVAAGENRGGVVRLNADGTLDTSFNASWILGASGGAIQPDGKIVVGARYEEGPGYTVGATIRLNPDGSRDLSFPPSYSAYLGAEALAIQADGKILVGLGSGSGFNIYRLNPNGTPDNAFTGNLPSTWATEYVTSIIVDPDGKIIVGGADIIRLNSDGTRDNSFAPADVYYQFQVYGMVRQPDGKIIVGGNPYGHHSLGSIMKKTLSRVNADGTVDETFDPLLGEDYNADQFKPLALRPNGTVLISGGTLLQPSAARSGLVSLNPNGAIDQTFTNDSGKIGGSVSLLANQPDGKILVGGYFVEANNFSTFGLARLNLNGTTDTNFSFSRQITGKIAAIAFQTDGKILIGGNFRFNNQINYGVFRLNQNGSIDPSFTPRVFTPTNYPWSSVNGLGVQADGKILVGGVFQNYGNSGRDNFLRLNPNGSVDTTYDAMSPGIDKMFVQPDGKIIVRSSVTVNGVTRNPARLNTDGSLDLEFNVPDNIGVIFAVAPDGKLASAGSFSTGGGHSVIRVFRLKSDGTQDPSFTPTDVAVDSGINDLIVSPDGRIVVNLNPSMVIVKANGGVERSIASFGIYLSALIITADGNLLVGGYFSSVVGSGRTGIARFLLNSSDFDFDGDGKADISLFRPTAGDWYVLRSSDGASFGTNFGLPNDLIAPADFDGDGKTDISVFRPSDGSWYRLNSLSNTFSALQFGASGDLPVPGDFDGDGRADIAVYRPSAGSWYRLNSSNNQFVAAQFGIAEDKPLVGDFNGDGKSDLAVFRPSNGYWYRLNSSSNQFLATQFGVAEDKPAAADYDGDGKTDLAVYRPSGGYWYHINSGSNSFIATQFGIAEDKPTPADYDGDGKADFAVFRPSNGTWYLLRSTQGFTGQQYGTNGDVPAPNAFVR